ncbi:unnamed protein product [Rotaria socialis]|uniref:Dual serine/threonine and tyrosine protein kinase n=1 Tax=Rotaria socialis TaxID=392032 RepID=A0A817VK40_9BILA|nr:unnamed protein product [Rotaria socialis]CAF3342930.1 unnamed protein product [Rotaria socialis]CAF3616720.1 unnamed protein product [Rotaria socialis]CAF4312166.1 unnamed protein product [Rotaria socialis]CAF4522968.1 unnamed protein product [Rotaria socialis]
MTDKFKTSITNTNSNSSLFTQEFAKIIRRYKRFCVYIKRLLEETNRSYNEINDKRVLVSEKFSEIKLSEVNREFIENLSSRPVALIICSQTYNGKARFVNELLNETLLPESPIIKNNDIVRMIRIKHHVTTGVGLNISGSFELVDTGGVQTAASWSTVPREDIIVNDEKDCRPHRIDEDNDQYETALLEIRKPLILLGNDLQILITPSNQKLHIKQIYSQITEGTTPIFVYIIDQKKLSDNDLEDLRLFRTVTTNEPILFIRIDQKNSPDNPSLNIDETPCVQIFKQLFDLGFVSLVPTESCDETSEASSTQFQSDIIDNGLSNFPLFLNYIRKHLDRLTIRAVSNLQCSQELCLDIFNDSAFEMARDMLITPKRLNYTREKEKELYESLISLTNSKQNEIQKLILEAIGEIQERLIDQACSLEISGIELTDQLTVKTTRDLKKCTNVIQDFVLERFNKAIAEKLVCSVSILHEDYVGTLTRCLSNLERNQDDDDRSTSASEALQEILQSAYQVNISVPTNSNFFKILIDKMKELFRTFSWSNCPRIDPDFKRSVASTILQNLSEAKLAKGVCAQLNDRIRMSHENFDTLLKQLEHRHSDRLKSTEDKQQRVRKEFTPKIARHLLESTSLKDLIEYGLPKLGRELGRGQYGVVYECESWANQRLCVLKSVVPPDDRHWNDLALEFHYLRRIPEHPRVVKLIGSVIDYSNRDQTPVLLVMERLKRDLHAALKHKLPFQTRIQISLDVIEGLRYLHGLGLVHRDIKLKNVLLDSFDHARLTDLGFCKPEVMMSGSLVGTPIHMAPELFTSKYDHTVDIYAFGILFWYICSNCVKLPSNFDICPSKDVLWSRVKQGVRPERLSFFTDECWEIMIKCWQPQPSRRPYLGEVQEKLEDIFSKTIPNV